jgi:pimeloyl-ACP methyl ester carboxylesterase
MTLPTPLLARHHGREVHGLSLGRGEPATVLLTGLGVPARWWHALGGDEDDVEALLHSPPWNGRPCLAPLLAASGRVVSYDRAGIGESGPPTAPRDLNDFVEELEAVLAAAGVVCPVRLVGHSIGGVIALEYARRRPERVAGLVLLDSSHPDQLARFAAVASPDELEAGADDRRETALHHPERPDLESLLGQGPLRAGELGELPLLVVSRTVSPFAAAVPDKSVPEAAEACQLAEQREGVWQFLQADLATLSTLAVHLRLAGSRHDVHLDQPESVVRAIVQQTGTSGPTSVVSAEDV